MTKQFSKHLVVPERVSDKPVEAPSLRGNHHPFGQCDADPLPLPFIPHDQPHLGAMLVNRGEAAERHDLGAIRRLQLRDQRQAAAIVPQVSRRTTESGSTGIGEKNLRYRVRGLR